MKFEVQILPIDDMPYGFLPVDKAKAKPKTGPRPGPAYRTKIRPGQA